MIVAAASRFNGVIYTMPPPARHHTIIHAAPKKHKPGFVSWLLRRNIHQSILAGKEMVNSWTATKPLPMPLW